MEDYCPNDCGICKKAKEICFYSEKNLSFKCPVCKEMKSPHDIYEYRGFKSCPQCFDKLQSKVDLKRQEVIEITKASVENQRNGEFVNNFKKYNIHNVASDGLPIIPTKEPQILKDYEHGIL